MEIAPQINIIGCGKLGKTIGHLLAKNEEAEILGIVNSSLASAEKAVQFIGQGKAYKKIAELLPADIYFIASPDSLIQELCQQLLDFQQLKPGTIILHFSGLLSSSILNKAHQANCYIASLHPIKSFADLAHSVATFKGTYCAYEGDPEAYELIYLLFEKIGGIVFPIEANQKATYHAASIFAANYLITLFYHAVEAYRKAGIAADIANDLALKLMSTTLGNLEILPPQLALTGPIERGDFMTIESHVTALNGDPLLQQLYKVLGLNTLALTHHPEELKTKLKRLLS